MATTIVNLPAFVGTPPNKYTQQQPAFDTSADSWVHYEYTDLIPAINSTFIPSINTLATELETARDASITYAGLSLTYSTNSANSAIDSENSATAAASSATSAGTALAAANAILGVGIATSYIDASGHIIFYYDDGTVATPPSLSASGHLLLSIEV